MELLLAIGIADVDARYAERLTPNKSNDGRQLDTNRRYQRKDRLMHVRPSKVKKETLCRLCKLIACKARADFVTQCAHFKPRREKKNG